MLRIDNDFGTDGATEQLSFREQLEALGLKVAEKRASIEGFAVLPDRELGFYEAVEFVNVKGYVAGISYGGRDRDGRTLKEHVKIVIESAEII